MKYSIRILVFLVIPVLGAEGLSQAQEPTVQSKEGPPAVRAGWVATAEEGRATGQALLGVDLRVLKEQMNSFQNLLNRSIQESFEQPFSLLQDTKGSYLPNFGVVFHLEMNLHPLRLISPFDMRPYTPEELRKARADKLQRIEGLKDRLSELLLEQGAKLTALPPEQRIAVVVHLFNLPSEQSDDLPTQLVMETSRQTLLDSQAQRLTAKEFQKWQIVLEF